MRVHWLIAGLALSCYGSTRLAPAPAPAPAPPPQLPQPPQRTMPVEVAAPAPGGELYALDEALADALSGPLVHVGTGEWFGLFRINACAYRNDRVFVINIYCTTKEMSAFGLVVLSPSRGRAYLYAEAKAPISKLRRADYFTFKGETEPAIVDARLPALDLGFNYAELRKWDETRYKRYVPGCYGGVELNRPQGGCLEALAAYTESWAVRNKPLLDEPPADWYHIVGALRARAQTDGRHLSRPGG